MKDEKEDRISPFLFSIHPSSFTLHTSAPLVVFDEFTSVVDRNVARVVSAAIAKGIRAGRIPGVPTGGCNWGRGHRLSSQ